MEGHGGRRRGAEGGGEARRGVEGHGGARRGAEGQKEKAPAFAGLLKSNIKVHYIL